MGAFRRPSNNRVPGESSEGYDSTGPTHAGPTRSRPDAGAGSFSIMTESMSLTPNERHIIETSKTIAELSKRLDAYYEKQKLLYQLAGSPYGEDEKGLSHWIDSPTTAN